MFRFLVLYDTPQDVEPYFLIAELDWDDMAVPKFAGAGVRSMVYELEEV
jgi:hypothetical protein